MILEGKVFSGVNRGKELIKKYEPRIIGILGLRPFPGTLNVKMERETDLKSHSTKTIDFLLTDGKRKIDAYLAPVVMKPSQKTLRGVLIEGDETVSTYKWKGKDAFSLRKSGKIATWDIIRSDADRELIEYLKNRKENAQKPECKGWAIQFVSGPHNYAHLEIISGVNIKESLKIKDDDKIRIEFLA